MPVKPAIALLALIFFCRCNSKLLSEIDADVRMLDYATITPESNFSIKRDSFWSNTKEFYFLYRNLLGFENNTAVLIDNDPAKIFITRPTIIVSGQTRISNLVFPGDSLIAVMDNTNGDLYLEAPGNGKRTQELLSWARLMDLHNSFYSTFTAQTLYDINRFADIVVFERHVLKQFDKLVSKLAHTVDSVSEIDHWRKDLREVALKYTRGKSASSLVNCYAGNRYSYSKKDYEFLLNGATELARQIRTREDVMFYADYLDNLFAGMVVATESDGYLTSKATLNVFATIAASKFAGISRDYIISATLFEVLKRKVITHAEYVALYQERISDRDLRALCKYLGNLISSSESVVFATDIKKGNPFEKLLEAYKGNLVYIDFGAGWCIPCKKEMPYLRSLKRQYAGKDIRFMTVAVDSLFITEMDTTMLSTVHKQAIDTGDLMHFFGTSFSEIPRYMLLDRNGLVITDNAPAPQRNDLRKLIDRHLSK